MHIEQEQIQRLLHGELEAEGQTAVRRHLDECAACRSRVAEAEAEEAEVYALLRHVDHATPRVTAAAVRSLPRPMRWGRWAAAILIAVGATGAVYAAPGSPLPRWTDVVLSRITGSRTLPPAPADAPPPAAARESGISVPAGENLVIDFVALAADSRASVSLSDSAEVAVRALGGAARFDSGTDRLSIESQDPAMSFEVRIPRAAPHVEIRARGRVVFLKNGATITTDATTDLAGRYVLRLAVGS